MDTEVKVEGNCQSELQIVNNYNIHHFQKKKKQKKENRCNCDI